jgi:hypothetical protein
MPERFQKQLIGNWLYLFAPNYEPQKTSPGRTPRPVSPPPPGILGSTLQMTVSL